MELFALVSHRVTCRQLTLAIPVVIGWSLYRVPGKCRWWSCFG